MSKKETAQGGKKVCIRLGQIKLNGKVYYAPELNYYNGAEVTVVDTEPKKSVFYGDRLICFVDEVGTYKPGYQQFKELFLLRQLG